MTDSAIPKKQKPAKSSSKDNERLTAKVNKTKPYLGFGGIVYITKDH